MTFEKHNSYYILEISELTFYIDQCKDWSPFQNMWQVRYDSPTDLECINANKSFRTPEKCKDYIIKELKKFNKKLSKELEGK